MAGVIWGFHRDGNIGRFLITNVICLVLSPNVYWVLHGYGFHNYVRYSCQFRWPRIPSIRQF